MCFGGHEDTALFLFALTAGQIPRVFLVAFGLFDGEELIFGIEQGNTRGCEFGSFRYLPIPRQTSVITLS